MTDSAPLRRISNPITKKPRAVRQPARGLNRFSTSPEECIDEHAIQQRQDESIMLIRTGKAFS
jgi:hypothetical protein